MQNNLKILGLSYNTAPLAVREAVSLNESTAKKLLIFLKEFSPVQEAIVLSTCNRTEVYYSAENDLSDLIVKGIALCTGNNLDKAVNHFDKCLDGPKAVKHLFRVSMGLDAQVVGDIQISNQVKNAYQWCADEDMAGPFLHRLMHAIFFTNKRVVQETAFRDGAASVSYAATELIDDATGELKSPKVLVLGVGEIGADVCRNLIDSRFKNVAIANRTSEKAEALALECGFSHLPYVEALENVHSFDIIISSVSADKPILTPQTITKGDALTYQYFMDLSMPRSIDPQVETLSNVVLYNLDDIQSKASKALDKRLAAIPAVENIIDEAIVDFQEWSKEMAVSPTIKKLKNALEQIRKDEMAKYLKSCSEKEAGIVDKVTKSMMQKVMKLPVLQLKAACKRGEAETLIDVLNDLFDLERQPEQSKKS